jgi:branched-chain amino acid aminotransferase
VGPFFAVPRPLKLYAENQYARAWPGGTGAFKLGLNYAPAFNPQRNAIQKGYDQVLWLLDEAALLTRVDGEQPETGKPERCRVTEAGAMNVFFVLSRPDSEDLDVVTPLLDGTILPGVTRASVLELSAAHPSRAGLDGVPSSIKLFPEERTITLADIFAWVESGKLKEMFSVGTAVTVAPIGALGFTGRDDLALPLGKQEAGALGMVGAGIRQRIDDIQMGRYEWNGWSVVCDTV